jgi:hypothetical protein
MPASSSADYTGSKTRCICGRNDDNEGFMIQCDRCEVWQHGDCIGLTDATVPEKYYCELCQPEHVIHKTRDMLMAKGQFPMPKRLQLTLPLPPSIPPLVVVRSVLMLRVLIANLPLFVRLSRVYASFV